MAMVAVVSRCSSQLCWKYVLSSARIPTSRINAVRCLPSLTGVVTCSTQNRNLSTSTYQRGKKNKEGRYYGEAAHERVEMVNEGDGVKFVKKKSVKPAYHEADRERVNSIMAQATGNTAQEVESDPEPSETPPDYVESDYHSIIKDHERGTGSTEKHEFQAETRKLLDIVAKSLYTGKEVFIRELISNASDALEKLRYLEQTGKDVIEKGTPLEIHIATNDTKKTFTIQDTGIGMTRDEMIDHLGTIAKSGSQSFMEQVSEQDSKAAADNIIGQFGVGFYSAFMVAEKVEVFSKAWTSDSMPQHWISDGAGQYEITDAEGVQRGTKIILQLRGECYDYAKDEFIQSVITKYSNFVGFPIFLNGKKVNTQEAIWLNEPRDVSEEDHTNFFKHLTHTNSSPQYTLHYSADAPLNIRALFYIPEQKPNLTELAHDKDHGVALYSRKVLITPMAPLIPKWLRFLVGVVDSEDVPLNLSREFMQDHELIRKLTWVLTNRVLKYLHTQAKKDPVKYLHFYMDYGVFIREGIVTTNDVTLQADIAKLLRLESSALPAGEFTTLTDYTSRMRPGQRNIFYLCAPSRELAESSPYYEAMAAQKVEVLFAYGTYDDIVLHNLRQFDKKKMSSVDSEAANHGVDDNNKPEMPSTFDDPDSLSAEDCTALIEWIRGSLGKKISRCKATDKLVNHPCVITVVEIGAIRHFLKTPMAEKQSADDKYRLLDATFEFNPSHHIIKRLNDFRTTDPEVAQLLIDTLFDSSMVSAGLLDDARGMVHRLNKILEKSL